MKFLPGFSRGRKSTNTQLTSHHSNALDSHLLVKLSKQSKMAVRLERTTVIGPSERCDALRCMYARPAFKSSKLQSAWIIFYYRVNMCDCQCYYHLNQ